MSNGDDEPAEGEEGEGAEAVAPATLEDALDAVAAALAAEPVEQAALEEALGAAEAAIDLAETEADLDAVDDTLDDVEAALEGADLPEPDPDDDGDETPPREALEDRLAACRETVAEARGPYAQDVIDAIDEPRSTIADTRWTEQGVAETVDAVATFVAAVTDTLDATIDEPAAQDGIDDALGAVVDAIEAAGLDPDDDADTIAALIEATDAFAAGIEAAEAWDDLTVRQQLQAEGFYDVLEHHKDFPPEWSALKVWERRDNAEMILLALEKFDSDFMEEHCLAALRRMGPTEALEPMLERAGRRDQAAIEILGKIGSDEALETILEFAGEDADEALRRTTLKALGEIGAEAATQVVADALVAESESVRSRAARALGMIGDPRAIDPLADALADDPSGTVRGSAAWALNQIGTEPALEAAAEYVDDRVYLVQAEAEKAAAAMGAATA